VTYPLQPAILDLKRIEISAGPQNAVNLCKCPILQLSGTQMVQHKHRNRRRKALISEGQSRGVALYHGWIYSSLALG
jgi:hypothetical protein